MDASIITPAEIQQWLGELLLEIKMQAKRIKMLEAEIERLKSEINQNQPERKTKHKST